MTDRDRRREFIRVGGLEARLLRSARRTVSLQVGTDLELVVKAPNGVSEAYIADFLSRRSAWTLRQLERMRRIKASGPQWRDGGRVPFLGRDLGIAARPAQRSYARLDGDRVLVSCRDPNNPDELRAAIERLFAREAAERLPPRLDACLKLAFGLALGDPLPPPALRIRTMKARWGSCDPQGRVVTLNSRLMRFRTEVIDCVIMHELAHLKYRSHGPRFYALLGRLCPDYEGLQAELADVFLE